MPRKTHGKTTSSLIHAARDLRQVATPAEQILWQALRGRRLNGLKFRRQHPIGRLVLDMFCVERQLAIELDGSIHLQPGQAAYDAERTAYLHEKGIRVLRFTNEEVESNLDEVLNQIIAAVKTVSP